MDVLAYRVVELEHEDGYRFWSEPMLTSQVTAYIDEYRALGYGLSDIDYVSEEYFQRWSDEQTMPCGCESGSCYCDDDGLSDAEADAMTLASAGWGTEEDYGYYGGDEFEYSDYGE